MHIFRISETFPGTTVKQVRFISFEDNDVESKDKALRKLVELHDPFLKEFYPKHKPYWQTPPLPEYV